MLDSNDQPIQEPYEPPPDPPARNRFNIETSFSWETRAIAPALKSSMMDAATYNHYMHLGTQVSLPCLSFVEQQGDKFFVFEHCSYLLISYLSKSPFFLIGLVSALLI
jgi:hypothetical protein